MISSKSTLSRPFKCFLEMDEVHLKVSYSLKTFLSLLSLSCYNIFRYHITLNIHVYHIAGRHEDMRTRTAVSLLWYGVRVSTKCCVRCYLCLSLWVIRSCSLYEEYTRWEVGGITVRSGPRVLRVVEIQVIKLKWPKTSIIIVYIWKWSW